MVSRPGRTSTGSAGSAGSARGYGARGAAGRRGCSTRSPMAGAGGAPPGVSIGAVFAVRGRRTTRSRSRRRRETPRGMRIRKDHLVGPSSLVGLPASLSAASSRPAAAGCPRPRGLAGTLQVARGPASRRTPAARRRSAGTPGRVLRVLAPNVICVSRPVGAAADRRQAASWPGCGSTPSRSSAPPKPRDARSPPTNAPSSSRCPAPRRRCTWDWTAPACRCVPRLSGSSQI